jgi:hypothetical protein
MVRFYFRYKYTGPEQHFFRYSKADFRLVDDLGNHYNVTGDLYLFRGSGQYQNISVTMESGNEAVFIVPFGGDGTSGLSSLAQDANSLTLFVDQFDRRITHAEWRIEIP